MTNLIRCRGSLSEMAGCFKAEAEPGLIWRPLLWPGQEVPVVSIAAQARALRLASWGLPSQVFAKERSLAQRATLFGRDIAGDGGGIMAPERMVRCLIVLESFAYPEGPADLRTRVWAGLWYEPLCAWAGLCMPDWSGCAGILVPANALLERVSAHMPLLLPPEARRPWLEGCSIHALGGTYPQADWYLERSDEHWSKGTTVDDTQS